MTDFNPVVVGVDGSAAASAAIEFGAHEAKRLGIGIRLVHVVPSYAPATPLLLADMKDAGRDTLVAAAKEAAAILSTSDISTTLLEGGCVAGLLHAAEQASLVVLGAERRPAIERLFTGSVVYGVAGRAGCPVVAVPPGWSASVKQGSILVGVKSAEHSSELIRRVLEIAAERKSGVVLLHTWELPNEYDDLIAARVDENEWADRARRSMELSLSEVDGAYAEVPVEIRVEHGQAARVLQRASGAADLLVLARRRHAFPIGHIGGTGRALLRDADCAVEVVAPANEPADADNTEAVLEQAGNQSFTALGG